MKRMIRPFFRLAARGLALAALGLGSVAEGQLNYSNYTFVTLAGTGPGWLDGAGSAARFSSPFSVAVDGAGNCYVADLANSTIRKVTPAGVVSTVAGLAGAPGSSDGTGAAARFFHAYGVAVDSLTNLYVADTYNCTIRKITPAGAVKTLAGSPGSYGTNDGTGSAARFTGPTSLVVDPGGTVYVVDRWNSTIRKITPKGVVTTLAGQPGVTGSSNGVGLAARFNYPYGLAMDAHTNLYVADTGNETIRKITPQALVSTIAGSVGNAGFTNGFASSNAFNTPVTVAVDSSGNLYVADLGNNVIRKITPAGEASTLAGSPGNAGSANGTNSAARFNEPAGVALDSSGDLYVTEWANCLLRCITQSGGVATVTSLAGAAAAAGSADGAANAALFSDPAGVAVDPQGTVYVADSQNNTIRRIGTDGAVTTLAGTAAASGTNDGTGAAARFSGPNGVAVDTGGNLYVADSSNNAIRKVTPAGVVTTLAGSPGLAGTNDGVGKAALFSDPLAVAVDAATNLYVADAGNNTVRKITPAGTNWTVTTLAGSPSASGTNDGTGSAALFNDPSGVAVDANGNVYVADKQNDTIRKITPTGTNWIVTTLAGTPQVTGARDGAGGSALFYNPSALAVDAAGYVYVTDTGNADAGAWNNLIRRISPAGAVSTLAGSTANAGSTDGTGAGASFYSPAGIAVDGQGNLYVANTDANAIRRGWPALPDTPGAYPPFDTPGPTRHLNVTNLTVTNGAWTIIRYPAASSAQLSSTMTPNPTLTLDVADLFVLQFAGTNAAGRAALGALFVATNVGPPTLTILQPALGQTVNSGTMTAQGTAFSGVGLSGVRYQLNGGPWAMAQGGASWTAPLTLTPGANTFRAAATAASGQTSHVSVVSFQYTPLLTLEAHDYGYFSPDLSGVPMTLGKKYTVTAIPDPGYVFENWVNGSGQVVCTTPTYTFVMTAGLELAANFILSPYPPAAGSYAGLFGETNNITPATAGAFSGTLTSQGNLMASLAMAGTTYTLSKAPVSLSGAYSNATLGPMGELLTVTLQVDLTNGLGLTGVVEIAGSPVPLTAQRAIYSATQPAPQGGKHYTLMIAPGSTNAATGPAGYGYGAVSVDNLGNVTFSGMLGDGTAVSRGSFVGSQGNWPLYLSPSAYQGQGLAWGWVKLGTNAAQEGVIGKVSWMKNSVPGSYYPSGFNYASGLEVLGSLYVGAAGVRALEWTNGVIELMGGNLAPALNEAVVLGANDNVSGNNQLNLTITTTSGLFQGSITPKPGATIKMSGAVLQNQNAGYGVFKGSNQSGSVFLGTNLTTGAELEAH
jgi:hypothetical protein